MKRFFFYSFMLVAACNKKHPPIDGAYTLVGAQYGDSTLSQNDIAEYKTIKVLKNGYWMAATFFGSPKITVESASGGTYTLKDDKYIETVNFSSENGSAAVGKTYSFNYKLRGDTYTREGIISNDKCENCPIKEEYHKMALDKGLRDTSLEGVWKTRESEWFGKKTEDPDLIHFKIYSYPRFAWGAYHSKGKDFIGVGGGTYHYDGKKLIEHLEYFSYYDNIPGDEKIDITKLPSGAIKAVNVGSAGKEIWEKIQ